MVKKKSYWGRVGLSSNITKVFLRGEGEIQTLGGEQHHDDRGRDQSAAAISQSSEAKKR